MASQSTGPRAFYPQGGVRRKYVSGGSAREGELVLPPDPKARSPRICPPAILDAAPDGSGLGVWVLFEQTEEDGETYCTYEYGGGVA
jgi:hypothetical protein